MRWFRRRHDDVGGGEESRTWLLVALVGLLVAGGSVYGLWRWVSTYQQFEPVLVAARAIPAYQVIQDGDLRWAQAPKGSRQPGTVHDLRSVVGRVARETLYANEQIRGERLADSPLVIGPGERAVAVPSDLIRSVGGTVRPGDAVDALWVTKEDLPARLVASGAVVIDLRTKEGQALLGGSVQPSGVVAQVAGQVQEVVGGAVQAAPSRIPAAVVLKVRADEMAGLAQALTGGQIVLAKRQPPR